jgi:hypothetical protein
MEEEISTALSYVCSWQEGIYLLLYLLGQVVGV